MENRAAIRSNERTWFGGLRVDPENNIMKTNVGSLDRLFRILAGCAVLGAGYHCKSWWGFVGLLPLVTAFVRFCPAYVPFGLNTCAARPDQSVRPRR